MGLNDVLEKLYETKCGQSLENKYKREASNK